MKTSMLLKYESFVIYTLYRDGSIYVNKSFDELITRDIYITPDELVMQLIYLTDKKVPYLIKGSADEIIVTNINLNKSGAEKAEKRAEMLEKALEMAVRDYTETLQRVYGFTEKTPKKH